MFIINPNTNRIKLTKGDTATMYVWVVDQLGNRYEIQSTDVITLTVRQSIDAQSAVLTKTATEDQYFIIEHSDTSQLSVGMYTYDIQLVTAQGEYFTIVPTSIFELTEEVTR